MTLGITGSFGSGKTTVARMFKRLGASCIDADRVYHRLIKCKSPTYKKIVSAFGREILKSNKEIERKKLGKIVFSSGQNLKKICQLTHPAIIREIKDEITRWKRSKGRKVIVIDAPLLIEAGLIKMMDKLIVVKANKKNQIARSTKLRKFSRAQALRRIKAQAPLAEKLKLADYIIDNNGTLKQTQKQVKDIWKGIYKDNDK